MVTGLREVAASDASTQLDIFKEVLDDIGEYTADKKSFVDNAVCSIKNTISDRCATQKKFNNLFKQFRKDILPKVVKLVSTKCR